MKTPKISFVAALSENRVIGKDGHLPWHIAADLKHYRALTKHHVIIMGRKTFDSIGRPLPERVNIVITHDQLWKMEGVIVVHSLEEAVEKAKEIINSYLLHLLKREVLQDGLSFPLRSDEICIIGGGHIFSEALPLADILHLTLVYTTIENGDAFFPDYSEFKRVLKKEDGESNGYKYTFIDLIR